MTSSAMLSLAANHARKRLRCDDVSDADAVQQLVLRVLSRQTAAVDAEAWPPTPASRRQYSSATQQLLALLALAVGRTHIVSADEAAADSDEETDPLADATPPREHSPSSRATITHSGLDLPSHLAEAARSADGLPPAVKRLLEAGADANARDADANSPLFLAVFIPDTRAALVVVHELLRRGADPNSTRCGGTMLNHALSNKRAPIVQRLLREGAYPHPTKLAPKVRLDEFSRSNGYYEEALLHMRKALWTAAKDNDVRAFGGLLQHGCPADQQLLFTLVRQRGNAQCVAELLRAHADANMTDNLGTHVLTIAVLQGDASLPVVRSLLAAGADPTLEEDGATILAIARRQCTAAPEILRKLEEHVAGKSHGSPVRKSPSKSTRGARKRSPSRSPALSADGSLKK